MVQIPRKSKAAVLVEYGKPLQILEYAIPEVEPGGILVKVEMAGICGTDVHQWHGRMGIRGKLPNIPGHGETIGRIVLLGKGRTHDFVGEPLQIGDWILWGHQVECGECYWCRISRQPTLCANRIYYGTICADEYPHLMGGFAEYAYIIPRAQVVKVPKTLTAEEVIGVGCAFKTAVSAYERLGGLGLHDDVVIQGAGPVGLYCLVLAREAGVRKIIVIGAPQARLDLAKKWGADHVINIEELKNPADRKSQILSLTNGRGPDVVVEASGVPVAFQQGLDMIRKGGKYLVIGQASEATTPVAPGTIMLKGLNIIGSLSGTTRHYYEALQFIETRRSKYSFADIVTTKYSLEQVNDALAAMEAGNEIKPVIDNRRRQ